MGITNHLYGYRIGDPADEDCQKFLDEKLVCMSKKGIKRECEGSNSGKEKTGCPAEYWNNLKSEGVVTGKERKSMLVGQNLHVSNGVIRAHITPSSHVSCLARHKVCIGLESDFADKDYQQYLGSHMVDKNLARGSEKGIKRKCERSNSGRAKTQSPIESGKNLKSEVDVVGKEGKSMLVGQNLQVSNGVTRANKTPSSHVSCVDKHRSNIELEYDIADEDYQQYVDFYMVGDEKLSRMSKRDVKRKYERNNSGRAKTQSPIESGKNLKSEVDVVGKEGKSMLVGQSLQVSNGVTRANKIPSSHVSCVDRHRSNIELEYDIADEDYQQYIDFYMVGDEKLSRMSKRDVKRKYERNNSGRAKIQSPIESGKNLKSEVDVVGKEGKSMLVGQNLQVSNEVVRANKTPSSHVSCVDRHRSNLELEYDLADEDYQKYLDSHMVDDENLACISKKGIKRKCERSNSGRAKTQSPTESGKDLKSDGDVVAKEGKSSFLGQNLQVSDCIILLSKNRSCSDISNVAMCKCCSEVQSDSKDEDYEEYLSSRIDGENVDDFSSSDSELVIMDSDPYHENTPFISSKTYDSSWFADEGNHGDNWLVSANRDSQFRKGLGNILESPYDQGEYEHYWQEITCQKPKERHRETRSGEIESCPVTGANKSYLELHKDLRKAIDGTKEQHKVLFYLRGFFYWLEHLTQEGSFRPWLDASCLEMLTKM